MRASSTMFVKKMVRSILSFLSNVWMTFLSEQMTQYYMTLLQQPYQNMVCSIGNLTKYLSGFAVGAADDRSVKVSLASMTKNILVRRKVCSLSDSPSTLKLFDNKDPADEDLSSNSTDFKSQTYELMFLDRVRIDIKNECGILDFLITLALILTKNYIKFNSTC